VRLTTWNVNGYRSAVRGGFWDLIGRIQPHVLMLQEIKCHPERLRLDESQPPGWHTAWTPADKAGYAGTAVWSREPIEPLEAPPDPDGRVTLVRTAGLVVGSLYVPSGTAGPERQAFKETWLTRLQPWAQALAERAEPVILGGDLNIAHSRWDLHDPVANRAHTGFLPRERAWLDELLQVGWIDLQRCVVGPELQAPHSFWSRRRKDRLNRGWRLDYVLGNDLAARMLRGAETHQEGGVSISDHAPVSVDLAS